MTMNLEQLLQQANVRITARGGVGNPAIADVVCDSRTVSKGALFVAVPGTKVPGDTFIADAVARGASAVMSENAPAKCLVPWIQVSNARRAVGELGKALWRIEPEKMTLVGITGTNGKTTTAHLFKTVCEQRFDPSRVWMFGTINYQLGAARSAASHTTPEALDIFRLIGRAAERPEAIVMEASSHALALDRVGGMSYDVALLTNVTQDHLDFHTTMERYYLAKKRLFTDFLKANGTRVVNIDDPWGARLAQELGSKNLITYGRAPKADVRIANWECTWEGTRIELSAGGRPMSFESALRGFFNVYNMTALYAGALALSFDRASVERAFAATTTVPGRMDRVPLDASFAVIVDYAHTPDALVNILQTSRPLTKGRLLCVFGCGGDRDRTKRPIMGSAVASLSDEAIVTSDNPRSEKPTAIIEEILKGMPLDFPHQVIPDRREAIKKSLQLARSGDCIVIAGKGHEDYQEIQGVKHPFDDREIVIEIYKELNA
jgi:UDP-N-acetylmuramoyl-L-alanyl-D-glutamate--2,6-diaminopimelate ligase